MNDSVRVLVVDDDPDVRDLLEDYLSEQGYEVTAVDSASVARESIDQAVPNVVLLDVGLPGEDGLSLARYIRESLDIAIIMISGAGETVDRIVGLEVGADDYVAKPFDLRELKARLKSVLRRYQSAALHNVPVTDTGTMKTRRVPVGERWLDLDSQQLFDEEGAEIPLTRMEFELLEVLVQRPNRPLTRDQLLSLTQNQDWNPFDRSVDIRIARLRRKIEPGSEKPRCLRTVRGVGYMYVPARLG